MYFVSLSLAKYHMCLGTFIQRDFRQENNHSKRLIKGNFHESTNKNDLNESLKIQCN